MSEKGSMQNLANEQISKYGIQLPETNKPFGEFPRLEQESKKEQQLQETLEKENEELKDALAAEKEIKQELQLELKALYKQFETLKKHVELHKVKFNGQVQSTDQVQQDLLKAEQKSAELHNEMMKWKEEVGLIKQHLSKGMRDAKELQNRFCEAVTEKVDILKEMRQLQREFDKQHQDLINTKEKLKGDTERAKASNDLCVTLEVQCKTLQEEKTELSQTYEQLLSKTTLLESEKVHFERQIEDNSLQIRLMTQRLDKSTHDKVSLEVQRGQLLEEVSLQKALNEEKDFQLEEARQHFAKKMFEVSQMNDAIEDLIRQAGEHEVIQRHLEEANSLLEGDAQKSEDEKKELSEKIAALEMEVKRWERSYHLENKQRQLAEEKNAELKKIEQCHAQLQNLLSGFGGSPPEKNGLQTPPPLQFGTLAPQEETCENEPIAKPYSNLFDFPQAQTRSKQNLFD